VAGFLWHKSYGFVVSYGYIDVRVGTFVFIVFALAGGELVGQGRSHSFIFSYFYLAA